MNSKPTPPKKRSSRPKRNKKSKVKTAEDLYFQANQLFEKILDQEKIPTGRGTEIPLRLDLDLSPHASKESKSQRAKKFASNLMSRLELLAEDLNAQHQPFPPGKLRCHWCEGFDCQDASPPEPKSVFKGYSATGLPIWSDFGSLALERSHPRVQELYEDSPVPITILQPGDQLNSDQLKIYGKNSSFYKVLAQLTVGYMKTRGERGARSQISLTIQAVETRRGRPRVHLNVLGVLADGRPIAPFLEEVLSFRLADAIEATRRTMSEIHLVEPQKNTAETEKNSPKKQSPKAKAHQRARKAYKALQKLEKTIDRIFRQNTRRTLHSRTRHRDRERPAATALRDALKARTESFYRDIQENTWVVLGPRRRVHIFNDEGQHVTSVTYPGETIRKRTSQGKWRHSETGKLSEFQAKLKDLVQATGGTEES